MKTNYQKQGKRNQINGRLFELKVRSDLESKGWIVSRWGNNVEMFDREWRKDYNGFPKRIGKCIPAKQGPFRKTSTGFPDFIAYKSIIGNFVKSIEFLDKPNFDEATLQEEYDNAFQNIFIECKSNGYLSKEEKEKARWFLENNYCSKFLVAKKKKVGRKVEVEYKEFK